MKYVVMNDAGLFFSGGGDFDQEWVNVINDADIFDTRDSIDKDDLDNFNIKGYKIRAVKLMLV